MSSSNCSFTCISGIFLPLTPSTTTVYARSAFYPSLHFTLSLQSASYTQSAFYPWSAVSSPQSAVCVFQNRSVDKVKNRGNERRCIYKDPREDSGQTNISYTRYPKKCFTQNYRELYGDAMLVLSWLSSNMVDGNQQKHLLPSLATKA